MNSIKILMALIICLSSVNLISAMARTNGNYSPKNFKDYVSASGMASKSQRNFTGHIPNPEFEKAQFSIPLETDGNNQEYETQVNHDAERLQNGNGCQCPGMDQEYDTNKKYESVIIRGKGRRGHSLTNDNECQCPIIEYYPNVARDAERNWNDNGDRCPRISQEHETLVIRIMKRKRNVDDFRSHRKDEEEGVLPGVEVRIG